MKAGKKILFLSVLLIVLIVVANEPKAELGETATLEAVLRAVGAQVVEGEVQYYAWLNAEYLSFDEMNSILLQAAEQVALQDGMVESGEGPGYRLLNVQGPTVLGSDVQIVVQSNPAQPEHGILAQSYLLVICRDSSAEKIKTVAERLEIGLRRVAPNGQLSCYLTGELPGRRTEKEMSAMAEQAVAAVRGKVIEGVEQEGLVSLTVYAPQIDRYLYAGSDRFNLNLAIRYDGYHDRTVCWVGFPIIHTSY